MPAAPGGPSQHPFDALLRRKHKTPAELPYLAHAQRHPSPREVLQALRRLRREPCAILFHGGAAGRGATRRTVPSAYAPSANGRCRYPPVQLRTAYCSRPPAPVASSKHWATVQRLPATGTTVARTGPCGANPTYAGSSVGARRLRRPTSPRRQWSCRGAAQGSHVQSYQRGPLAPSPARNRPPPLPPTRSRSV
jgi:hypothetical protein